MKNPIPLMLFACASLCASNVSAQDLHFSQFTETPLLRNPALAGLFSGDVRVQTVYRNQWQSVSSPYKTVSLNAEFKKPIGKGDDFLTIGAEVLYDKAGTIAMTGTHLLPTLNYHKSLSAEKNMYLSLGFMGGYVQRKIDQSKITTNNQFDGLDYNGNLSNGENLTNSSYSYFDAAVGLSFNAQLGENQDNNFYTGIAYHHFNKPHNISFYNDADLQMLPKWVYSAGIRLSASDYSYITFQGDYSKQKNYSEIMAGFIYSYKLDDPVDPQFLIHAGLLARLKDAIIPVVKIEKRPLSLSFSYDINTSLLSAASKAKGGFEMSLTYQRYIVIDDKYTSKEAVRCPRF